ncbi:puromycin-sensitive aminopeptidase-related [Anaeramoeba ignava]|uniref:Aminopeptidase n=1 Tax=Anaeramoeba ignava TaxID=1746090 RepID=A0A9Q0LH22_ANAIG|nr:puromycin-sensitive aminopeptidase-related [Anaeramoeba ignava]
MENETSCRLPLLAEPTHYKIHLKPDLVKFVFEGDLEAKIKIITKTKKLKLHSKELEIHSVFIKNQEQKEQKAEIIYQTENETVDFVFEEELDIGEYTLLVKYTGQHNDKMAGFYRSVYTVGENKKYAVVTQLEPTDARRVLPCWDEPSFKAIFELTLTTPAHLVTLSNMPIQTETQIENDLKIVSFQPTPKMSSYLFAIVVGEFDFIESKTPTNKIPVRVYTPLGKQNQGTFALDVCVRALDFYEKYFGIDYVLPKMDLVAIPDFSAGAMENWGLITYREIALLTDENSSQLRMQAVARTIAHELVHQWFGNLCSPEWWKHLWLNEGFAVWMTYVAIDHLFPEWDSWSQFGTREFTWAQELDGLKSSHPIEVEVNTSAQINEIFDPISYYKGACLVQMVRGFLGDEPFRKGINHFLLKFKFSNAGTEDLWEALKESSGVDVASVMRGWTQQTGFPYLLIQDKDVKNGEYTVLQKRFLFTGEDDPTLWKVPLHMIYSDGSSQMILLEDKAEQVIKLDHPLKEDDPKDEKDQKPQFPVDRFEIQSDYGLLASSGIIKTSQALSIYKFYKSEDSYPVFNGIISNFITIMNVFDENQKLYSMFQEFGKRLFEPVFHKLGWDPKDGEGVIISNLRISILGILGRCNYEPVIQKSKTLFENLISKNEEISPDFRGIVYSNALRNGGEKEYDAMLKMYRETNHPEEKYQSRSSRSDSMYAFVGVCRSLKGRDLAWDFLQQNWSKFWDKFGGGLFLLSNFIEAACSSFKSIQKLKEIEDFFQKTKAPSAERTIKQSLENISKNAKWVERDTNDVDEFLSNFLK